MHPPKNSELVRPLQLEHLQNREVEFLYQVRGIREHVQVLPHSVNKLIELYWIFAVPLHFNFARPVFGAGGRVLILHNVKASDLKDICCPEQQLGPHLLDYRDDLVHHEILDALR